VIGKKMEGFETDIPAPARRPRTITVLVLLAVMAVILSYLFAFALTGALASADVIKAWPRGTDPRPKWFLYTFVALMSCILLFGGIAQLVSRRQLRSIDAMSEGDGELAEQ
jgi:hypothetical protein